MKATTVPNGFATTHYIFNIINERKSPFFFHVHDIFKEYMAFKIFEIVVFCSEYLLS